MGGPESIRTKRVNKARHGICADCPNPCAVKKNGELARLCVVCAAVDRARAARSRDIENPNRERRTYPGPVIVTPLPREAP